MSKNLTFHRHTEPALRSTREKCGCIEQLKVNACKGMNYCRSRLLDENTPPWIIMVYMNSYEVEVVDQIKKEDRLLYKSSHQQRRGVEHKINGDGQVG